VFLLEIDLTSSHFSQFSSQVSDDETSTEARQERGIALDLSRKIMAPWTFDVKFPCGTQFTFGSLTFAVGEDENLKMLPPWPAPKCLAPVNGPAPYFPAISSTGGGYSSSDPYAGQHICTIKRVRVILIVTSILQLLAGASSPSSSTTAPDQDSADDYPKIGGSTCGNLTKEGHLIIMVAPAGGPS
jgi:hypothetical protein